MNMTSTNNNSIILQIGDLKLSDTEYTFGNHKIINNIEYTPLCQLGYFILGDYRLGTEIKFNDNKIFLTYSLNRPTSNAQNIAIGYFAKTKYHFIKESFSDIYSEKPIVITRSIITLDNIFKPTNINETIIFDRYSKNPEKILTKKDEQLFSNVIKNIKIFENAFTMEQLTALSKKRFKDLKDNDEKQKYLKYHQ